MFFLYIVTHSECCRWYFFPHSYIGNCFHFHFLLFARMKCKHWRQKFYFHFFFLDSESATQNMKGNSSYRMNFIPYTTIWYFAIFFSRWFHGLSVSNIYCNWSFNFLHRNYYTYLLINKFFKPYHVYNIYPTTTNRICNWY